MNHKILF